MRKDWACHVHSSLMESTSLADALLKAAVNWPERDAVIFPATPGKNNRRNYQQLLIGAMARARSIMALGIKAGDHVGIFMPDCIDFIECLFACCLAGAKPVPVNIRYRSNELSYLVKNADIRLLLCSALARDYFDIHEVLVATFPELETQETSASRLIEKAPLLQNVVLLDAKSHGFIIGENEFEKLAGEISEEDVHLQRSRIKDDERAVIVYTSGTTANPKGCILSDRMLLRNSLAMAEQRYYLGPEERLFDPLPLFHMAAILPMLAIFQTGGTYIAMMYFDAGLALKLLEEERITIAFLAFPTITSAIINHPDFDSKDLSHIHRVNNVAPPDTLARFQEAFPQAIQTAAYGLTEAGGVIAFNDPSEDLYSRLHSCGPAFDGIETMIIDPETGNEVETGKRGEIIIRGYSLFDGYYKNPSATADVVDADGWLHSGDLCSIDDKGRIYYHGRIKDMLKVGGENVSALEIESFLCTHPAIKLAQVVGMPDPRLQEVAVAFVELYEGASCTEEQIIEHCRGEIASFKVPAAVRFTTDWPMSATKIQKFRLRERLINEQN